MSTASSSCRLAHPAYDACLGTSDGAREKSSGSELTRVGVGSIQVVAGIARVESTVRERRPQSGSRPWPMLLRTLVTAILYLRQIGALQLVLTSHVQDSSEGRQ